MRPRSRGLAGAWAAEAGSAANAAASVRLSFEDRLAILLADAFIGVMFTAALLLIVGLLLLFLAEPFKRQWAKTPTFSVGIALLVMLVFQTYGAVHAHGSGFA